MLEIRDNSRTVEGVAVRVERRPVGSLTWRLLAGLPIAALAASMILAQVAVHRTADPSFECPKCHWTGVASLKSFVVVVPSRAVQPKLGDGDPMNRRI